MNAVRNPFRNAVRRIDFETICAMYRAQHKTLFATTSSGEIQGRAGNSWSSCFWAGYDGMTSGTRVPERDLPAYVWYRAGKACATLAAEAAPSAPVLR